VALLADAYGVLQESSALVPMNTQSGQAWFSTGDAKPVRDFMLDLEKVNRSEP